YRGNPMKGVQRGSSLVLLSLVVTACFSFAVLEASGWHTDDGCQVELHCFACHWAFASTGVMAPCLPHGPSLEIMGAVVLLQARRPLEVSAPRVSSRSPPVS